MKPAAPRKAARRPRGARKPGRIILLALGALAVGWWFVEGGEYGTSDLVKQKSRRRAILVAIDSLEKEVDSLRVYRKAVETDARLQEKIAREEFGMVKGDREILYRFAEPSASDSATKTPD